MRKKISIILSTLLIFTIIFSNFSIVFSASFSFWPNMIKIESTTESEDNFNTAFEAYKKTVTKKIILSQIAKFTPKTSKFYPFLEKYKGYGTKEILADYIDKFWMPYIGPADDPKALATVITDLTAEDWSTEAIKTAIWNGLKAFVVTTNRVPTKADLDMLVEQLNNQEYYYADLPIKDKTYTYTTIQDIGRLCNFSNMFCNLEDKIYYFEEGERTWAYESEENAKAAYKEKFNTEPNIKTITNPNKEGKPICIVPATTINPQGEKDDVYLITLAGTGFISGQSTGLISDVLSGCESNSPYLQTALKTIIKAIPPKSNNQEKPKIILAGFSLGGMIAQQLMVQPKIYENYDIQQVILLGCPALCIEDTERTDDFKNAMNNDKTKINRVIDKNDLIPYCSADYFRGENQNIKIFENLHEEVGTNPQGSVYNTFIGTHFLGYMQAEQYKDYDVFGFYKPEGNDRWQLKVDYTKANYYDAPNRLLPDKLSPIE